MKKTIRTLELALGALLLSAASPELQAAPPDTGIQGKAALYISYGTPVELEPGVWVGVGDVMLPVVSSFSVLSARSGREVGHFSTGPDGAFTIALRPGKYVVVPDDLSLFSPPFTQLVSTGSFEVTISAKKFTAALILYYHEGPFSLVPDTGD